MQKVWEGMFKFEKSIRVLWKFKYWKCASNLKNMLKVEKASSQIKAQRWKLQKNYLFAKKNNLFAKKQFICKKNNLFAKKKQYICKKTPNFGVGGWETIS